jgi:aminoglycoside phosphotransferase (APT) family kinase protein
VHGETRSVRPAEQLDWAALAAHLRWHLPPDAVKGLDLSADMTVSQFPGGHSNLTYLIRFGGAELVVRRPPLGPVAPRAHDMAREYRWLSALHPLFPLAPRAYLLCDDPSVIGSVFYVMERRRGLVVRQEEPLPLAGNPGARQRVSEALVDALADLHAVDASRAPVAQLGKPAGFVRRQVDGWTERWHGSRLADVPDMDHVAAWLGARVPPDPERPAVVHGDFKLDNVLLDPLDVGRLAAVVDWEMSALGDPLVDLGILLAYWTAAGPDSPDGLKITSRPGYLTSDAIVDRYASRSGRDVTRIRFYEILGLFKIAVLVQQIFYRYSRGQTDDPRFAAFGDRAISLARHAAARAAAGAR